MFVFVMLALAFLAFMGSVCVLLAKGLKADSLWYDMNFLWEKYPADVHAKIRKTFESRLSRRL
jgi:hypothetical protein